MVKATVPNLGEMYYLVDENLDFIQEVKEFLDWKAATLKAPSTIKEYCSRLRWYYRFLYQKGLKAFEAKPSDLTNFVIWLSNPYRDNENVTVVYSPSLNCIYSKPSRSPSSH